MKIVAKCSAFVSLSYHVHVKICNPIPLIIISVFISYGHDVHIYHNSTL